jgi:carbon monoxide dehydrogenase subunit G
LSRPGDGLEHHRQDQWKKLFPRGGDAQVGGTIAAIGLRLIDGTAKMMTKKFFEKLAEAVS